MTIEKRYLELLKQSLTHGLWDPPPVPVSRILHTLPALKRGALNILQRLFARRRLGLVMQMTYSAEDIEEGRVIPEFSDSMIGMRRMNQLQDAVETVIRENIEGDLVEAGVWRGGACILMRAILLCNKIEDRKVYVADSFAGFPEPDLERYPEDHLFAADRGADYVAVSLDEVKKNFEKYDLLNDNVVFIEGYFETSLKTAPIEHLSVLRVDADMYGSTLTVLETLYPRLSPGGFCIIDDYAAFECRRAIDHYREQNNINDAITEIDYTGIYWRKS